MYIQLAAHQGSHLTIPLTCIEITEAHRLDHRRHFPTHDATITHVLIQTLRRKQFQFLAFTKEPGKYRLAYGSAQSVGGGIPACIGCQLLHIHPLGQHLYQLRIATVAVCTVSHSRQFSGLHICCDPVAETFQISHSVTFGGLLPHLHRLLSRVI